MMSAFSIKPHMTHLEAVIFLLIISTYSTVHLLSTAIARMFYERTLDKVNLLLKVIKTGCFLSILLTRAFNFNLMEIPIIIIFVTPCVYGISILGKSWADKRIYDKLTSSGASMFKDDGDLEHAIYIVLDFLESDDPIVHAKF